MTLSVGNGRNRIDAGVTQKQQYSSLLATAGVTHHKLFASELLSSGGLFANWQHKPKPRELVRVTVITILVLT